MIDENERSDEKEATQKKETFKYCIDKRRDIIKNTQFQIEHVFTELFK